MAFTTERHAEWPLLVQGAGAGGAVTASGLLAEVLEVARTAQTREPGVYPAHEFEPHPAGRSRRLASAA